MTLDANGGRTGWPPGLLQDDCRGLFRWFADRADSRRMVRMAVQAAGGDMKHKVRELSGRPLDAAVAKALGWTVDGAWCTDPSRPNDLIKLGPPGEWAEGEHFAPSTLWADGGPIIEREIISLSAPLCVGDYGEWSAFVGGSADSEKGPTPLIAAMRAYVASKLGDEVDLPVDGAVGINGLTEAETGATASVMGKVPVVGVGGRKP